MTDIRLLMYKQLIFVFSIFYKWLLPKKGPYSSLNHVNVLLMEM